MRLLFPLLTICLLCAPAAAKGGRPARMTMAQIADEVLVAFQAKDDVKLKALAHKPSPDSWIVAEELIRRGEIDAGIAYARAGLRPATKALEGYITSRRGVPNPEAGHAELLKAQAALAMKLVDNGLAALPSPRAATDTVTGVRLAHMEAELHRVVSRHAESAPAYERSGLGAEAIGWRHWAGLMFVYAGRFYAMDKQRQKADACFERGLEHCKGIEFTYGAAAALMSMAEAARADHRVLEAIGYYERALPMLSSTKQHASVAMTLQNLGIAYDDVGNFRRAVECNERALPLWSKLGNLGEWAGVHINMGSAQTNLGNYTSAIRWYEKGIKAARAARKPQYEANGLLNIAGTYWHIGNLPRALSYTEQALEKMKAAGHPGSLARAMAGLGVLRFDLGDHEGGLRMLQSALVQAELLDDPNLEAGTLSNLARAHFAQGDFVKAAEMYERARVIAEKLADAPLQTTCLSAVGRCLVHQGKPQEGVPLLEQAAREARRLRYPEALVSSLTSLVRVHLAAGKPERAMFLAREARTVVERLMAGLGVHDAPGARGRFTGLFTGGALAAARIGDTAEALTFLETGRAGALLDLLGGRRALRWSDVPDDLRRLESAARLRETEARAAYQAAQKRRDLRASQAAARALDAAQVRVGEVMAKILAKVGRRTSALLAPRAATVEEIQKLLKPADALILWSVGDGVSLAIVLTPKTSKVLELGPADEIMKAVAAVNASDVDIDPSKAIATVKKLIVKPLALPKSVKRVLISPESTLSYLPYALVFDQAVALTPSGTTQVQLARDGGHRGDRVLALGDPDYGSVDAAAREVYVRGGDLSPLPATRPEAKAVGDTVLLGEKASETGLRSALTERERWRAVHFACHGFVNEERPRLSSLALSLSEGQDGFLTMQEIMRMDIPADLATLSACDTGHGAIVKGEGLMGLTRAFMYAGAPRVLCSLWKVDDEATGALMVKFYELWNPKAPAKGAAATKGAKRMGAATALQKAQAYVRAKPKWEHPYYWAGWVLWGLPD